MSKVRDLLSINPQLRVQPAQTEEGERILVYYIDWAHQFEANDAMLLRLLHRLPAQFTYDECISLASEVVQGNHGIELAAQLVENLLASNILVPANGPLVNDFDVWQKYCNSDSFRYLRSTADFPFASPDTQEGIATDLSRMHSYSEQVSIPPLSLANMTDQWLNNTVVSNPMRHRLELLATILNDCLANREFRTVPGQGQLLSKPVPSGGGRHPTEVFIVISSGSELSHPIDQSNGLLTIAYYEPISKSLKIRPPATFDVSIGEWRDVGLPDTTHLATQTIESWLVLCGDLKRSMWRYREPRSARAIALDVGHVVASLRNAAMRVGLGTLCVTRFDQIGLTKLLRITERTLVPLAILAVFNASSQIWLEGNER